MTVDFVGDVDFVAKGREKSTVSTETTISTVTIPPYFRGDFEKE